MLDHLRLVLATLPSLCCFCCNCCCCGNCCCGVCWRPSLTDDNSASLSATSCRFQLTDLTALPRRPAMLCHALWDANPPCAFGKLPYGLKHTKHAKFANAGKASSESCKERTFSFSLSKTFLASRAVEASASCPPVSCSCLVRSRMRLSLMSSCWLMAPTSRSFASASSSKLPTWFFRLSM